MSPDISQPRSTQNSQRSRSAKGKEVAASLSGIATLTNALVPESERMAPQVSLSLPLVTIARMLGQFLRNENLFHWIHDDDIVTVDPATGKKQAMTPLRFPTWSQERVTFVRETSRGISIVSLPAEMARLIIASDVFRSSLRPLVAINTVRLPIWGDPERTVVELLPAGYHEREQVLTVDLTPYDTDLLEDCGRAFLLEFYAEFPFARPDDQPNQPLEGNRNFAVQIACMLTSYCRYLLKGTLRPPFIFQANQQGSGKTLLAKAALSPVDEVVSIKAMPRNDAELGKVLTTLVAEGRQTVVFDNVRGRIESQELESFLTSTQRTDRILGKTASVSAPNNMQVVITGNALKMSQDLARRALLCDLFSARMVSERRISNPIRENWLASPNTRARFLAAMWSLVHRWSLNGCPRSTGATLPTFEEFASIIGGIVTTALLADPIAKPNVVLDEVEQGWIALFKLLAESVPDGGFVEYSTDDVLQKAEDSELIDVICGDLKALKAPKVALGKRITKWFGRQFHDDTGRLFEFGKRHAKPGAKYGVRILTPEAPAPDSDEEDPF